MSNRYNKLIFTLTLLSSIIFSQHFVVDLEPTGTTQLTIFSDSISALEVGDEIGIFDENAVTNYNDCTNQVGELLVGAGVWDGTQLNLVSVGAVDMCAFGGVQLSGFANGNTVVVKVWRESAQMEYGTDLTWNTGVGAFGDFLQEVSEIVLTNLEPCFDDEDSVSDLNGCDAAIAALTCDGEFPFESGLTIGGYCPLSCGDCTPTVWGCMDNTACNYDDTATGDNGCEYAVDNCTSCDGTDLGGQDCLGVCEGTAIIDECDICEGDGTSCYQNIDFSLADALNGGVDVFMANTHPILGFQFDVSGMSFSEGVGSGGSAEANGFTVSTGPNGVLGFTEDTSTIPVGDGLLTTLSGFTFEAFEVCITDIVLAIEGEGFQTITAGECIATDAVADCNGDANGSAVNDECGVCDGPGLNDDGCCEDLTPDCAGECGGDAYLALVCNDIDGDGLGDSSTETEQCIGGETTISNGCDLPDLNIFLGENGEVFYNSSVAVGGFQFAIDGAAATGYSGGDAVDAGFAITAQSTVIGFSFTGATFGPGCGIITTLELDGTPTGLSELVFSDASANSIAFEYFSGDGGSNLVTDCSDTDDNCFSNVIDCAGTCDGTFVLDNCDECVELGTECAQDCNGELGGEALLDECGTCDADTTNDCVQDCDGEWGGSLVDDECGVCGGDDLSCSDCAGIPNGEGTEDCTGECNGSAMLDECDVCNGDNSTCADCAGTPNGDWILVDLCHDLDMDGLGDPDDTQEECVEPPSRDITDGCDLPDMNIFLGAGGEIFYNSSTEDIGGFQFELSGATINSASGGAAEAAGFMISASGSTMLGFSLTGSTVPAGCGTLAILDLTLTSDLPIISGITISDAAGSAISFEYYEEPVFEEWVLDCTDMYPDCTSNEVDCLGDCDGSAMEDCAGDCAGSAIEDCAGDCDGSAMEDCAGVCDGGAMLDDCGVCNGENASQDDCGVCDGDGSSCNPTNYVVDLESTGVTQLTIFSESISSLQVGDEIGIFDENGITNYNDCANTLGELLVGSGVWNGDQLNLVSIGSADLCDFGGVQIAGYVGGNPLTIRVYRASNQTEYETISSWAMGTGNFGDIIQSVSELQLLGSSGDIVGCMEAEACNFDSDATINSGCEYAEENYDCNGNCAVMVGCDGECGGMATVDDCGICGGDSDGDGISDYVDNCGECFGDDSSCTGCMDMDACNYDMDATIDGGCELADMYYDCAGDCVVDTDADGVCDELELAGCTDMNSCNYNSDATDDDSTCDGGITDSCDYCLDGSIEDNDSDDDGTCDDDTIVVGCTDEAACNFDANATVDSGCEFPEENLDCSGTCLNDTDGDNICDELEIAGCTDEKSCNYDSNATDDDDTCDEGPAFNLDCDGNCTADLDCLGECGGMASIDDCGVCDDDSSNDCVEDCAGDWGGNAQSDQCGTCLDGTQDDGYECTADCSGVWGGDLQEDCAGACGGIASIDDCGVCDGGNDSIDDCGVCDGSNASMDCAGECNGSAMEDCAGECNGSAMEDCAGECGGSAENLGCGCGEAAASENFDCDGNCTADLDYCGECAGDNSTCATYPTVLTVEEWSAVYVDQYDETCAGESTGSTSGPFDLGDQECDSIAITFKSDGSFNAVCETSLIPISVPGSWVIYNDNMLCLAVGNDSDCTDYTYYEEEGTFGLSGFGDDGNCYETLFQYTSTLAIDEFGIPTDFSVDQNYPNPFNPSTTIEFDVAISSNISLVVYDLMGKEIYSLASGYHVPGRYSVVWNANDSNGEEVSSGMYIYQLRTSDTVLTKKLVLLR